MPRTRYTLADLTARLHERVGNNFTFWKDDEVRDALNEGIAFWQALTGEWTTRVSIEARSDSPSFYPVPKQIVSLTRVGIQDEAEALNPLRGHILPNWPVYKTGPDISAPEFYHTVTDRPINWSFKPGGGVGPYRIVWDFGEGPLPEVLGTYITHTFPTSLDQTNVDVTATVTDSTGDVFTTIFPVEIRNQEIQVIPDGEASFDFPCEPGGTSVYTLDFPLEVRYQVNGNSGTELSGNAYLNRYPILFEFDFTPFDTGDPADGGQAGVTQVDLLDSTGTVRETLNTPGPLKFFHTANTLWEFSNGWAPPLASFDGESAKAYGGFYTGFVAGQEITNYTYDTDADSVPEAGFVRLHLVFPANFECPSTNPFNFTIRITDGTGLIVTRRVRYFLTFTGV